ARNEKSASQLKSVYVDRLSQARFLVPILPGGDIPGLMLSLDTRPLHYHVLAAETRRWSPAHTPNCERTIVTHFLLHRHRSCPIILYLPNRSVVRLHFFITPEGKTTTPYFRGVYLFSAWHGAPKSVRCPAREDVEDTRGTARNWNTGNKLRA